MGSRPSLRRAHDFKLVYRDGRRARVDGVTVFARASDASGTARLGLAVPRQGGAVARNKLRRQVRSVVDEYGPRGGVDVVVRLDTTELSYQELEKQLLSALQRAGVGRAP